jgi:hypothetical protein
MRVCKCDRSTISGQRDGLKYELIGEAFNVGTQQTVVVYRAVDGTDAGKMFVTTRAAWEERFKEQP